MSCFTSCIVLTRWSFLVTLKHAGSGAKDWPVVLQQDFKQFCVTFIQSKVLEKN